MTLRKYLNDLLNTSENLTPSSIMYYVDLNSNDDGQEIQEYEITETDLVLEGSLKYSLDTEGELVNGVLQFDNTGIELNMIYWGEIVLDF